MDKILRIVLLAMLAFLVFKFESFAFLEIVAPPPDIHLLNVFEPDDAVLVDETDVHVANTIEVTSEVWRKLYELHQYPERPMFAVREYSKTIYWWLPRRDSAFYITTLSVENPFLLQKGFWNHRIDRGSKGVIRIVPRCQVEMYVLTTLMALVFLAALIKVGQLLLGIQFKRKPATTADSGKTESTT